MSLKSLWQNQKYKNIIIQLGFLALVVSCCWLLFSQLKQNLAQNDVATGFAFLHETAGFSIIMHLIDYTQADTYGRAFWVGLLNTLLVSSLGILLATFLGFLLGIFRLSSNWLVAKIASVYVETIRNIPLLLQLFFWYFVVLRSAPYPKASWQAFNLFFWNNRGLYLPLPSLGGGAFIVGLTLVFALFLAWKLIRFTRHLKDKTGQKVEWFLDWCIVTGVILLIEFMLIPNIIHFEVPRLQGFNFIGGIGLIPEFIALLLALSIYTSAFIAEIVRSGILAVDKGQTEAALALGLKYHQVMRMIIIPQALRVIIPPLTNQYLNLTKNSSLAAAIAYPDLVSVFAGTVLNQTGQAVEVIAITMAVYLFISLFISGLMLLYEHFRHGAVKHA